MLELDVGCWMLDFDLKMRLRVEIETPDRGAPSPREEVMTHDDDPAYAKNKKTGTTS